MRCTLAFFHSADDDSFKSNKLKGTQPITRKFAALLVTATAAGKA